MTQITIIGIAILLLWILILTIYWRTSKQQEEIQQEIDQLQKKLGASS